MNSIACTLNVFSADDLRTSFNLRRDMQGFLSKFGGCIVVGTGQSYSDPSYFDVELRFQLESNAQKVVRALTDKFSTRCAIDIDWIR